MTVFYLLLSRKSSTTIPGYGVQLEASLPRAYEIDYGMEQVTDYIYGYDFDTVQTAISWAWVTYEIDAGRPFVLCMWDNPTYGDHAVCAYGYEDDGEDSIRVFSTYDKDTNRYIAYGNWSYAGISDVHP